MKRALIILLAVLIAVPTMAAAKTAVYVTSKSCAGLDCSCLPAEDALFCDRLKKLGYDVVIDTEGDVKDKSTIWQADSAKADLIFLGDVSQAMTDKTKGQPAFCNNVKNSGKKVFATFGNAYKNRTLEGCAFALGLVNYPSDDNICKVDSLWVTETGYITRGFALNDIKGVYTAAQDVKINYGTSGASAHCDPSAADVPTGLYSAVAVKGGGTFWGLDKPSKFTDTGWLLFERAVLLTTGDNVWNVTFFTIPEKATAYKPFMIFAKVRSLAVPITEGSVNASLNLVPLGGLSYSNATGYWENRALTTPAGGELTVSAEDGSSTKTMTAGDLDARIISGSYTPGAVYTVRAQPLLLGFPAVADMRYRIWDSSLTARGEGDMKRSGSEYTANITLAGPGELIVEVTAQNVSLTGGAFKIIRPQNVTVPGFSVEPSEWVVTATKPGTDSFLFTITAGTDITGLSAEKSGELADRMTLSTTGLPQILQAGKTASFLAGLDWTGLSEGPRTGEIFVNSDQFSTTIPVRFIYVAVAGDWLEAEPKVIKVSAPAGGTSAYTIKLVNTASYPTTGIKVEASGDLRGAVTFAKEPYHVEASGKKDAELLFDARGKTEGTYSGTITVTSSLGQDEITADLEVTPDIANLLDALDDGWQAELLRLSEGGAQLSPTASQLSQNINTTLSDARAALAKNDYTTANTLYQRAAASLDDLKKEQKQGVSWVVILLVLAATGVLGYVGWQHFKKKKKEEKKKPELPKAEEQYRTEYY